MRPQSSITLDALSSVTPESLAERGSEFLGRTASRSRVHVAYALLVAVIALLLTRAGMLQLLQGASFRAQADRNRARTELLVPTRGGFIDRTGTPLVATSVRYAIALVPADLPSGPSRAAALRTLERTLDLTTGSLDTTLAPFASTLTEPVPIHDGLTYDDAMRWLVRSPEHRTLRLLVREQRQYHGPNGQAVESLSHVLGYVGRVSGEEYPTIAVRRYRPSDLIGKTGLEAAFESVLRGVTGVRTTTVDVRGRTVATAAVESPVAGMTLVTTIDRDLQLVAEQALARGAAAARVRRGAVVILDATTGEVRALVSLPTFSATALAGGVSAAQYRALTEDRDHPLFPRAISGTYPSGSTIKPIIAAAALAAGVITPSTRIRSTGGLRVGRSLFPDWKAGGHGTVDVRRALAESVNTFFYVIGGGWPEQADSRQPQAASTIVPLGPEHIAEALRAFGFGEPTGIDIPGEASGLVPTPDWKQRVKNEPWYIGDTYHLAIGQGDLLVTPLQVARATAAVANGGVLVTPHLERARRDAAGAIHERALTVATPLDARYREALRVVRTGMRAGVTEGSAIALADLPMFVAGKTGTAQHDLQRQPHAWFTGWAEIPDRSGVNCPLRAPRSLARPAEPRSPNEALAKLGRSWGEAGSDVNCRTVVITVLVEEGGEGSRVAVPIARTILAWWAAHPGS